MSGSNWPPEEQQLDQVDATMGTAIEREQVADLPINGRNWATLTALAPGATNSGAGDQRTIRFAGHGLDDNNLTLDGVDATAVWNQMQMEYMRLNIPIDSIAEFQVQSLNFGADAQTGTNGSVPGDHAVSGEERPDYVPGVPLTPPSGSTANDWVNAAAFATPASQTFGDLGRNIFRAPGIADVDLALAKDVFLGERVKMRFRADVFNTLNRAQYGAPNAVLGQSNFGVITTTISSYATGNGTPREFQLSAKLSF
jgi:hypothetical protein